MAKKYDCVVKAREYTNRSGETKAEWKNIGVVLDKGDGPFMLLDTSVNLAGLPHKDGKVLVSMFVPKDHGDRESGHGGAPAGGADLDDEIIPF